MLFFSRRTLYNRRLTQTLNYDQMLSELICLVVGLFHLAVSCLPPEQYCTEGPYCFLDGYDLVNLQNTTKTSISEDMHICTNHCGDLLPDHNALAFDSNNVGVYLSFVMILFRSRETVREFASALQNCQSK